MRLERVTLFTGHDLYGFLLLSFMLLSFTLTDQYLDYRRLTTFDDALVQAEVTQQYLKTKGLQKYYVLRLRMRDGAAFYTTAPSYIRDLRGYHLELSIRTDSVTYMEYLKGFFTYSKIKKVFPDRSMKYRLAEFISSRHENSMIGQIYSALFTASSMDPEIRSRLSALGISHLLAISGFHIGLLTLVLLTLLRPLYALLQQRFFPYRQSHRDLFIIILSFLFAYLWFLGFVPSLVRAFGMMLIGLILYDRGIAIFSMQTFSIAILLLISLWPRLIFALGFWLSVGGAFSILLFLRHFAHWPKSIQFVAIHFWVYLMMLPVGLWLFKGFSALHPLSVVWTMLFFLFYPFALATHLLGVGGSLDSLLVGLLGAVTPQTVSVSGYLVLLQVILALLAVWYKKALALLFVTLLMVFVDAVYQIT